MPKSGDNYYCDLCPTKKYISGGTKEGIKSSAACHLAIQHDELRKYLEEDEKFPNQLVSEAYYVSVIIVAKLPFDSSVMGHFVLGCGSTCVRD